MNWSKKNQTKIVAKSLITVKCIASTAPCTLSLFRSLRATKSFMDGYTTNVLTIIIDDYGR